MLLVPAGTMTDSDFNDHAMDSVSNDSFNQAQQVQAPAIVGGYVNSTGAGPDGRSKSLGDTKDVYIVELEEGQVVELQIAESGQDLDLFLYDVSHGGSAPPVQTSVGSQMVEQVQVPKNGTYFIVVRINETKDTASGYLLRIGATSPQTNVRVMRLEQDFVPGEMIVRFKEDSGAMDDQESHSASMGYASMKARSLGMEARGGGSGRPVLLSLGDEGRTEKTLNALGMKSITNPWSGQFSKFSEEDSLAGRKWETLRVIKAMNLHDDVIYAEPNYIRRAFSVAPNDAYYDKQWHYKMIQLEGAWEFSKGSSDVIVAVIDTGVLLGHPDLKGRFVDGYDFISDPDSARDGDDVIDPDPDDVGDKVCGDTSSFHGTHVAGTVAASTNNQTGVAGVGWNTSIMPLRVLGYDPDGNEEACEAGGGTTYDIMQAVRFAAQMDNDSGSVPPYPADVINMSFGGGDDSRSERDLFSQVRARGIISVAAAGNSGKKTKEYPAAYTSVIAVSAVNKDLDLASYSTYGNHVDVAAPGGEMNGGAEGGVLSTLGADRFGQITFDYGYSMGTSMATPHVAGVAALMKASYGGLTPQNFESMLVSGQITEDIGVFGKDDKYGYGLIDAYKAVVAAEEAAGNSVPVPDPELRVVPETLTLSSVNPHKTVYASNKGGGSLKVKKVYSTDTSWLTVEAQNVNTSGLGDYRISAKIFGKTEGVYKGEVVFESEQRNTVRVNVNMEIKGADVFAGQPYVLLLGADSDNVIQKVAASLYNGIYYYKFSNVPHGLYRIKAGNDLNNNGKLCELGEVCGSYSDLAVIDVSGKMSDLDIILEY